MKHEIVEKMVRIIELPSPSEGDVQHLFTLSRKLIEQLSESDKQTFALLRFYCDWTMHSKIDRSAEGALILGKIHALVNNHMQKKDNSAMAAELTNTLSLNELMNQINNLLRLESPEVPAPSVDKSHWRLIVNHLVEIISHCPLKIRSSDKRLASALNRIVSAPIKGR